MFFSSALCEPLSTNIFSFQVCFFPARLRKTIWSVFVWRYKLVLFSSGVVEDLKCLTELLHFFEMLTKKYYRSTSSKIMKYIMFNVLRQLIKTGIFLKITLALILRQLDQIQS